MDYSLTQNILLKNQVKKEHFLEMQFHLDCKKNIEIDVIIKLATLP